MTGRELIVYILQNHLEDEPIIVNGTLVGLMTESEIAVKFDVGISTVRAWYICGVLPGIKIGTEVYYPKNAVDPRKDDKHE